MRARQPILSAAGMIPSGAAVARNPAAGLRRADAAKVDRKSLPWPVVILFWSLPLPWLFDIGELSMKPYKLILLATVIPCFIMWISGKAGRIRFTDIALILFCIWCTLAIVVIHGPAYAVQPAGMIFIETMGGYLLGRCYVRDAQDFRNVVRLLFTIVAVMLPFAVVESVTGHNIFKEMMGMVLPVYVDVDMDPRWGLKRVQEGFQHPILFGVFAGSGFALVHLVLGYKKPLFKRWMGSGVVLATTFFSLSAGPLTGVLGQMLLIGWRWFFSGVKARWAILIGGLLFAIPVLELFANRSLPVVFISAFAFDESSAYVRILIWRFGTESIANHPLFGVGFNEWDRPAWMPSSIDMYWIIDTVRHGVLAGVLLILAFLSAIVAVALKKGLDEEASVYRTAYVITMIGFFLVGWTVYIWTSVYVLMLFLLASGMWFLDVDTGRTDTRGLRRTKVPPKPNSHG